MTGIKIHGGIRMAGTNQAISNLELEELPNDPAGAEVGRIWINTTENKIKGVLHKDNLGQAIVTALADATDITQLSSMLANKADKATTLAGYGITDNVVYDDDRRINNTNIKHVRKEPGKGEFSRIIDALNSIASVTEQRPYIVIVWPGEYIEPPLQMRENIHIRGSGQDVTFIQPEDNTVDFIRGANNSAVTDATVHGPSGVGKAMFLMDEPQGLTNQLFRLERIVFGRADTFVIARSGYVAATSATLGEQSSFRRGFVAQDGGVNEARISLRNVNTNGMTSPFPEVLYLADGPKSQILVLSGMTRSSTNLTSGSGVGVGIHVRNGGRYRVVGGSILGFDKGIWVENVGVAPMIECVGINLMINNQDIVIDHPGTTGAIQGTATRSKVVVNPDVKSLSMMYSDQTGEGVINIGPLFLGKTHSTLANIEPLVTRGSQNGLLEGGVLSKGTGLTVNVTAGKGYVKIPNGIANTNWTSASLTVTANATHYIYVDALGVVKSHTTLPDSTLNVILGRVVTNSTEVLFSCNEGSLNIEKFQPTIDRLFKNAFGSIYVSGNIVTENILTPRAIDITAGHFFYSSAERRPNAKTAPPLIFSHYATGAAAITVRSVVDNTTYDSGIDLLPLTAGYFTKHILYVNGDGDEASFVVAHGRGNYATLAEAESSGNPPLLMSIPGAPPIAALIVQQGVDKIIKIIDIRPRLGFAPSAAASVTSHGDLTGLVNDDHKQYLRTDGARVMSGPLDMGTNAINNAGNINGINIVSHASRHAPNGSDPFPTASAVGLSPSTTSKEGVANSFARSDHEHAITGFQLSSAQLSSVAALTGSGIVKRATDGTWTAGTLAEADIPALDWSKITTGKPTTVTGYGITDASTSNVIHVHHGKVSIMTGTSIIPYGDAQPTITNGTEILSQTVNPATTASQFLLEFSGVVDSSSKAVLTVAIFRTIGTTATFIGYGLIGFPQSGTPGPLVVRVEDIPNTTSPVTYSARIGTSASNGTWYLGRGENATMGGVNHSAFRLTEMKN